MIVLDASAVLDFLLDRPSADQIYERIRSEGPGGIHAPHVIDLEVAQALRRFNARGEIGDERAQGALDVFAALLIERYPHASLLPRIWQLRHNVTAYDAAYLSLAEALVCPLVTSDARLRSAPGHSATIELIETA